MNLVKLDRQSLFAEFGLDDLSEEEKDRVFGILNEIFNLRLLDALLERLSFEDQKIFLETIHQNEEKARDFLTEHISNLDELIAEVIGQVKKDFAEDVKVARKKR